MQCTSLNDVHSSQSHLTTPRDSSEVCSLLCHWCHPINSAHLPHIYPAHILFPIFLYTFFITCTDVCYIILLIRHTCHIYKPSAVQDGKSLITISKHWIWMQTLRREELNISKSNTHPQPFYKGWNLIDNFLTSPSTSGVSDGKKKQSADHT